MDQELYEKITKKKEFSKLLKKDVEFAFKKFDKKEFLDEEKVKLTRAFLKKVFTAFMGRKILSIKEKTPEWFLKKHVSTKERFDYYGELYKRIFKNFKKKWTIFDLGSGINGFSYSFFPKRAKYFAIESVGQLVELQNPYFKKEKMDALAIHESLFNLTKVKKRLENVKGNKMVFLFKVLDSLEMFEKDYSKKLLNGIVPLVNLVVVSFATKSLISRKSFKVKRAWFENFIKENFQVLDSFDLGSERYFIFAKK